MIIYHSESKLSPNPRDIYNLIKSSNEISKNINLLYECKNCTEVYSHKKDYICECCYGFRYLYFFDFIKFPWLFNEYNFKAPKGNNK